MGLDSDLPLSAVRRIRGVLCTLLALIFAGLWIGNAFSQEARQIPVTQTEIQAVVRAVQDEMYDEGCQGYSGDEADQHLDSNTAKLHVYIQPYLRIDKKYNDPEKGVGWAIYKYRPFGEVYREFWFTEDGLVRLGGHPQWGFPATDPSMLTIYMEDGLVCKFKSEWIRANYQVELDPSALTLSDAQEREKRRFGDNYVKHKRDCSFSWR